MLSHSERSGAARPPVSARPPAPGRSGPAGGRTPEWVFRLPAPPVRGDADPEREADRAAGEVMDGAGTPAPGLLPEAAAPAPPAGAGGSGHSPVVRGALDAPAGPLDPDTRAFMEARFGQDFSPVRVAAGPGAGALAGGLNARALAHGERILFAAGEYAPHTASGRTLIAHELAHVVQQRAAGRPRIALQGAGGPSLTDQAIDVQSELGGAQSAAARKPIVAKALQLAEQATSALQVAKGPSPPSGAPTEDEARDALERVVRALAASGELQAAGQVATRSGDDAVMRALVYALGAGASDVAGQQDFLVKLAPIVGEKLAPAGPRESPRTWLDRNTDTIGRIFKKLDAGGLRGRTGERMGWELSSDLLDRFFVLSDVDETPDPTGQLGRMNEEMQSKRIKADCDVWAAYGARLFRAQGWETVGYMVIYPVGRDAHAVALARRTHPSGGTGWEYLGVSNAEVRDLYLLSSDDNAKVLLVGLALDIYNDPKPRDYKMYFEPALRGGGYDLRLLDPENNNLTPYKVAGSP